MERKEEKKRKGEEGGIPYLPFSINSPPPPPYSWWVMRLLLFNQRSWPVAWCLVLLSGESVSSTQEG